MARTALKRRVMAVVGPISVLGGAGVGVAALVSGWGGGVGAGCSATHPNLVFGMCLSNGCWSFLGWTLVGLGITTILCLAGCSAEEEREKGDCRAMCWAIHAALMLLVLIIAMVCAQSPGSGGGAPFP